MTVIKYLNPYRATCIFAVVFVIANFTAALLLCRERLFLDTAYYFFHVVNEGAFRIEHQRVILAVSQMLLWVGVKAHLSLYVLLVLYSVTPVLFSAILLFISLYYFKNETGAWLVIFCNVCGTYFLYYSPMYEVCYATVGFAFLWFMTEQKYYQSMVQVVIYSVILSTCLLGYPLIALGCIALLSYYWVVDKKLPRRLILIYVAVFIAWLLVKTFLISEYEKGNVTVTATQDKVKDVILMVFSLGYIWGTVKYLLQHYVVPMGAFVVFVLWSIGKPQRAIALWLGTVVAVYLLIINLRAGGEGLTHFIHNERSYLLIVLLCLVPFLFVYYPMLRESMRLGLVGVFILVTMAESIHTWAHSSYYSGRIERINQITTERLQQGCSQTLIDYKTFTPDLDDWSIGMEAFIFSSMKGRGCMLSDSGGFSKMIVHKPLDKLHFLLRLDEVMAKSELNPRYFSLDTTTGYCMTK